MRSVRDTVTQSDPGPVPVLPFISHVDLGKIAIHLRVFFKKDNYFFNDHTVKLIYSSLNFNTRVNVWNHCHDQDTELFHQPQISLLLSLHRRIPPSPDPSHWSVHQGTRSFMFSKSHVNGIIGSATF